MQRLRFLIYCILFLGVSTQVHAQVSIDNAFPELNFGSPVDLQNAGDGSDRLFVVEQNAARILVFENNTFTENTTVFLNLAGRVRTNGYEEGLLGLAFHPNYAENGHFYVHYSASNPRRSVIERYTASPPSSNTADPESGVVILEVGQPYENHNGGQLAFGPDGYLYIALGDGGSGGDPENHGQNRTTLLGSILRIDVDQQENGLNYSIPQDNPYADNQNGYREEIYAYGLRNPWRMSFDPVTGQLWLGDVGQGAREEIDIIVSGGNYGWKIMEGFQCFSPANNCDQDGLILPVWDYGRNLGQSITGGHVYRGTRAPELIGSYVYADFATGLVWALTYDGQSPAENQFLLESDTNISSFGVSESGELYMLAFNGRIYHFTSQGLPLAQIESGPADGSTLTVDNASFTWSGTDPDGSISQYEVDLDGPSATSYTTNQTSAPFNNLADGSYTFCVRAQDNDGNWSEWSCSSFTINQAASPMVQIETGPDEGDVLSVSSTTFTWSGTDPDGTVDLFEVDISGALTDTYTTTTTSAQLTQLTNGTYTFCVRAQDNQGNWSDQACVSFSVDATLPDQTPPIGAYLNGTLPSLTPNDSGDPDRTPPTLLSSIDAFSNLATLEPIAGVIPYALIQPFWSDGAFKSRWVAIPNDGIPSTADEKIVYSEQGEWAFPIGTVFIKHFEMDLDETQDGAMDRLETRFLVHASDGIWYGLTYRWRDDLSDADLVSFLGATESLEITTANGTRMQEWEYPGRLSCLSCHSQNAGWVLGPKTRQLNRTVYYPFADHTVNQIEELYNRGFFDRTEPVDVSTVMTISAMDDETASLEDRVRSYLDVNCAYCHRQGGTGTGFFDARLTVPLDDQGIVDGTVLESLGAPAARVIAPADTVNSIAYVRLKDLTEEVMMPPIAKNRVDPAAMEALREWVLVLGGLPVELVRFEGRITEGAVLLSWGTSSETNNAGFTVERRQNANDDNWMSLAFVEGNGTVSHSSEYSYTDRDLASTAASYQYRLKQVDFDGTSSYSETVTVRTPAPADFALHDNYPNPFNPSTAIRYEIPVESLVQLVIYDLQGREIDRLVDRVQPAGRYTVTFEAGDLATGTYFYRLTAGSYEETGTMLFVK